MSVDTEEMRPNIMIEINNDNKMDVDSPVSENEGEINEDEEENGMKEMQQSSSPVLGMHWKDSRGIFATGINIFDKGEQEKLQERARRFALKPDEIHTFTDEDLEELHRSLGITADNQGEVKFNIVHLLGISQMSAEDILEYFAKYAPAGIEWIDNDSCNVVWLDNVSAARALYFNSKAVNGMPARGPSDIFSDVFLDEEQSEVQTTGQSILSKNKNRIVELRDEDGKLHKTTIPKYSVNISEITIPIPPGYWRLGKSHPKASCILVRFNLRTDKQAYEAESFSKYYKKLTVSKNIISDNQKKELGSIFERNKELSIDKNPWGSLARNWDKDAKFRERSPILHEDVIKPQIEVKNPKLLARLGAKRKLSDSNSHSNDNDYDEGDSDVTVDKFKNKMPRMKMYADEEEEKIKRKKILQKIKRQADKIEKTDLRNVLRNSRKVPLKEVSVEKGASAIDLGSKLKNRTSRLVFAVGREAPVKNITEIKPDIRTLLVERRQTIKKLHDSNRHKERLSRGRHGDMGKTLHSDRMRSEHSRHGKVSRHYRSSTYDRYSQKPKSKVSVVIKPSARKPVVASTIWSRVKQTSDSDDQETSSDSQESEGSSSSSSSVGSGSESESGSQSDDESSSHSSKKHSLKRMARPGFRGIRNHFSEKSNLKSPIKITMPNNRYKR
ncbi:nuclear cap-binding protein subunit 3-like [Cylas formicarius]|uniref:nuclear cap-binding protein subunit 3-like n=1 Tax=Cylas formicarius TaxID=197179 RepID=UPI002958753E|nr:nuclear cap-binding protein subunit 3-like [Cylas formicarius]